MAWHRGELADAEHLVREATVQWHRCGDRMDACDGIELLGVLAAARERFPDAARLLAAADAARQPLRYLAPGFTANRQAAARAATRSGRSFLPPWPSWHAWPLSLVTNPPGPRPSVRRAPSSASAARRSPPPRSATPTADRSRSASGRTASAPSSTASAEKRGAPPGRLR